MAVEIDVTYSGNLRCRSVHGPSGQALSTDAPLDNGGTASTFSPTDLVATALGTCMATVMGLVAKRRNLDLSGTKVHVSKEMTADPVRRIGRLTARVTFPPGRVRDPEDRALLRRTADACPVKQSLHPDTLVEIHFTFDE
jgi:putative redox protein